MATIPDHIECLILDLFGVIVTFDDRLVYDRVGQCGVAQGTSSRRTGFGIDRDG